MSAAATGQAPAAVAESALRSRHRPRESVPCHSSRTRPTLVLCCRGARSAAPLRRLRQSSCYSLDSRPGARDPARRRSVEAHLRRLVKRSQSVVHPHELRRPRPEPRSRWREGGPRCTRDVYSELEVVVHLGETRRGSLGRHMGQLAVQQSAHHAPSRRKRVHPPAPRGRRGLTRRVRCGTACWKDACNREAQFCARKSPPISLDLALTGCARGRSRRRARKTPAGRWPEGQPTRGRNGR